MTRPYWLEEPGLEASFVVRDAARIGDPEAPPPLAARLLLTVAGEPLEIETPVVYRWIDPVEGERYRLLAIAPPATARLDQDVYLFPDARPREVRVTVETPDSSLDGAARLVVPAGWSDTM